MMMTSRQTLAALSLAALIFAPALPPAAAQTAPAPTPTPTPIPAPTPTPVPTPAPGSLGTLNGFSLPSSAPPTIPARQLPDATPTPVLVLPTPRPTPTPTPATTPSASVERRTQPPTSPTPTPTPVDADTATDTAPAPDAAAIRAPIPAGAIPQAPSPASPAPRKPPTTARWLLALAALVLLSIAAFVLYRRRTTPHRPARDPVEQSPSLPATAATAPSPRPRVAPAPSSDRASLRIDFRPVRAGLNLLSALVEGEVTVRNDGAQPIEMIALATTLVNADAATDAELAAFFGQPIGRPAVPVFALAPGEGRAVRIVAPLARGAIRPLHANARAFFVPVLAIECRFVCGGEGLRTARAFSIGIERPGSAKLAPIWLDAPPQMYDRVAAREKSLI